MTNTHILYALRRKLQSKYWDERLQGKSDIQLSDQDKLLVMSNYMEFSLAELQAANIASL